jgi:hypothetical protein
VLCKSTQRKHHHGCYKKQFLHFFFYD